MLLVEDDGLILINTADMLTELGHEVFEAGSGERALEIARNEAIDLVISDLGLPGMGGEAFAGQFRALYSDIDIVFATGDDRIPVLDGRPGILLKKPYDQKQLARIISEVSQK